MTAPRIASPPRIKLRGSRLRRLRRLRDGAALSSLVGSVHVDCTIHLPIVSKYLIVALSFFATPSMIGVRTVILSVAKNLPLNPCHSERSEESASQPLSF